MMHVPPAAVGRRRRRSVHLWDRAAEVVITLGGLAVLAAVLGICVYLVWVVVPLFKGGDARLDQSGDFDSASDVRAIVVDEHRRLLAKVGADGGVGVSSLATGRPIHAERLTAEDRSITSVAQSSDPSLIVLGLDDGSIQVVTVAFESALLAEQDFASGLASIDGEVVSTDAVQGASEVAIRAAIGPAGPVIDPQGSLAGVVARTESGDLRLTVPRLSAGEPIQPARGAEAIDLLDVGTSADGKRFIATLNEDGTASLGQMTERRPLGGGPPRISLSERIIDLSLHGRKAPEWLFVTGDGQNVLALWTDGHCQRYSQTSDGGRGPFTLSETRSFLSAGKAVSVAGKMAGGLTLIVGDDSGAIRSWSIARDPTARPDGRRLIQSHVFREAGAPVVALAASARDRTFVVADAAGGVHVYHGTSEKEIASVTLDAGDAPRFVMLSPKNDGVYALTDNGVFNAWSLDPGHADASLRALFGPMRYEGEADAEFIYQSSAVTKSSEAKISLTPLIFGTLKATLFAMIFAAPIAVMAAVYTSEFITPRARKVLKPTIELMAGMPSVVLGLVAAIVLAPYIREHLPAVLTAFILAPLAVVVGASLWFVLPAYVTRRLTGLPQLFVIGGLIGLGAILATAAGPTIERALFRPTTEELAILTGSVKDLAPGESPPDWVGERAAMSPDEQRRLRREGLAFADGRVVRPDVPSNPEALEQMLSRARADGLTEPSIRRWLDGVYGSALPGWLVVLSGPAIVVAFLLRRLSVDRVVHASISRQPPGIRVALEGLLLVGTLVAALLMAWIGATVLDAAGLDARDSILGPFSARNTLVVGIIMGFAIIPIIYTISEDAMRSVPDSLRQASLGCGATPWQTAARVIMPVAASGIFSACMIGLGRAVGETMIVLMATGGTPEINWNIFSGFRTLAANIAIELPEAQSGSTHYRVLFLCGLVLFLMTIVINTTAELVRQRVRRRNAAL